MNFKHPLLIASAAGLLAATSASADTASFSGSIVAGPTFNRPLSLTSLSSVGTAVYYKVIPFTVSLSGGYTITQTENNPFYDGYIFEYATSFNPASPLTNLINGDDDYNGTGGSQITPGDTSNFSSTNNLVAGTQYYLVSSTYSNGSVGSFTGTIVGPGAATIAVPEPSTWALLAAGALGVGGVVRRRRAA